MLRVWNLSLLISTFSLTILATFLTRSGVLDSVHSFNNTGIGPALLAFFGVVVAVSIGLLAWRGDRLRSPGSIASPVSREGAFLVNNLLFAAFTLIVLLGTVFPLIVQAFGGGQITVGAPYFNRMTMPVVVCLLFLMAVAPVLPWRQTTPGLLRTRLWLAAATAVSVMVLCVAFGVRGLNPLLAFGFGSFAAATALRQLFVEIRRKGLSGLVGPSGGGMVVHVGVVVIAIAYAASHSFAHSSQLALSPGQSARAAGHTFTYVGQQTVAIPNAQNPTHTALEAIVKVDGRIEMRPAISDYPYAQEAVPTPSVRSSLGSDLYLTLAQTPTSPTAPVVIGVLVEPLVAWIWIGGGVMLGGTALAVIPSVARRRRRRGPPSDSGDGPGSDGAVEKTEPVLGADPAPVGAGARGDVAVPAGSSGRGLARWSARSAVRGSARGLAGGER